MSEGRQSLARAKTDACKSRFVNWSFTEGRKHARLFQRVNSFTNNLSPSSMPPVAGRGRNEKKMEFPSHGSGGSLPKKTSGWGEGGSRERLMNSATGSTSAGEFVSVQSGYKPLICASRRPLISWRNKQESGLLFARLPADPFYGPTEPER